MPHPGELHAAGHHVLAGVGAQVNTQRRWLPRLHGRERAGKAFCIRDLHRTGGQNLLRHRHGAALPTLLRGAVADTAAVHGGIFKGCAVFVAALITLGAGIQVHQLYGQALARVVDGAARAKAACGIVGQNVRLQLLRFAAGHRAGAVGGLLADTVWNAILTHQGLKATVTLCQRTNVLATAFACRCAGAAATTADGDVARRNPLHLHTASCGHAVQRNGGKTCRIG